jgi:hypothetical protein
MLLYVACVAIGYAVAKVPDRIWLWFAETPTQRAKRLQREGRHRQLIDL